MNYKSEETRQRQLANLKSFKKADQLTPEEKERQKQISIKGALARTEKQREKKNLQETTKAILETYISRDKAVKYLGDNVDFLPGDGDITVQALLTARLAAALLDDGNAKAYELLRDTSGQRPKDQVQIDAEIITAADRALMDKINARLSAENDPAD